MRITQRKTSFAIRQFLFYTRWTTIKQTKINTNSSITSRIRWMTYRSSTYPARFLERTFKGLKKFSGEPEDKDKYTDKDTFIGYYIEDNTFPVL